MSSQIECSSELSWSLCLCVTKRRWRYCCSPVLLLLVILMFHRCVCVKCINQRCLLITLLKATTPIYWYIHHLRPFLTCGGHHAGTAGKLEGTVIQYRSTFVVRGTYELPRSSPTLRTVPGAAAVALALFCWDEIVGKPYLSLFVVLSSTPRLPCPRLPPGLG